MIKSILNDPKLAALRKELPGQVADKIDASFEKGALRIALDELRHATADFYEVESTPASRVTSHLRGAAGRMENKHTNLAELHNDMIEQRIQLYFDKLEKPHTEAEIEYIHARMALETAAMDREARAEVNERKAEVLMPSRRRDSQQKSLPIVR